MNHLDDPFVSLSLAFNDPATAHNSGRINGILSFMSGQEIASYYITCADVEKPFITNYVTTSSDPQLQNAFYTFVESPTILDVDE